MSQTLKESDVWHLQSADRGLQTNPKSQLLKANRSDMNFLKWVLRLKYVYEHYLKWVLRLLKTAYQRFL